MIDDRPLGRALGYQGQRPCLVCLVTDGRLVTAPDHDAGLLRVVDAAVSAGVHIVQVRLRQLEAGPLFRLVQRCCDVARGSATRILVNDRVDVALGTRADGVHLRGDSFDALRVRALAPAGFVIGRSVHSAREAIAVDAAGGVDYLALGTVFASESKPGVAPLGEEELRKAAEATSVPVLPIGGISRDRLAQVARTGAAGIAAIGLFGQVTSEDLATRIGAIVAATRDAFDTFRAVP